ncbi:MAG: phage major capsid protein [Rhodocyclaceae bacterium]|nr:phage major capsid protein [Rhodocyclaceae bacterium]
MNAPLPLFLREHLENHQAHLDDLAAARRRQKAAPSLFDALATRIGAQTRASGEAAEIISAACGPTSRGGVVMPFDEVLGRDLTVGTSSAGGFSVTGHMGRDPAAPLRPHSITMRMGATVIPMPPGSGNLIWPRVTTAAAPTWVGESGTPSAGDPGFDQLVVPMASLRYSLTVSRRLLLQGLGGEMASALIAESTRGLMSELDRAILNGSGSGNEPTGILNAAGINAVVAGTNGAAPSLDLVCDMEDAVGAQNADDGAMGWATNSSVRKKLRKTEAASGSGMLLPGRELLGYPFVSTQSIPSDLDKGTSTGVCSALIYGNWSDVLVPLWSRGVEYVINPYTKAPQGLVEINCFLDVGVALRRVESFVACKDVLTA